MPEFRKQIGREELYERVWSVPMRTLAEDFGVSDVALAKVCRKLNIPVPPRGYWAKVKAGQKPRRPKLPRPLGDLDTVATIWGDSVARRDRALRRETSRRSRPVPTSGDVEPKVVRSARTALRSATPDENGMVSTGPGDLSVVVAPRSVKRAIELARAVLATSLARAHTLEDAPPHESKARLEGHKGPCVVVDGEAVGFSIFERVETVRIEPQLNEVDPKHADRMRAILQSRGQLESRWETHGTGLLVLQLCPPLSLSTKLNWRITESDALDGIVPKIIIGMERLALRIRGDRQEDRRREEERAAAARVRLAREEERQRAERRTKYAQDLRESFDRAFEAWIEVEKRRAFIEAIEAHVASRGAPIGYEQWIEWARGVCDEGDPLKSFDAFIRPTVLDEPESVGESTTPVARVE